MAMKEQAKAVKGWPMTIRRWGWLAVVALAACGGGGGGDAGGTETQLSATSTSVSIESGPVDTGPTEVIQLQIRGVPDAGLYGGAQATSNGVQDASIAITGAATGALTVTFKPGASLGDGSYTDTIDIDLCYDALCRRPVSGSPLRVTTRYTITSNSSARVDRTTVSATASTADSVGPSSAVTVMIAGATPASALHIQTTVGGFPTLAYAVALPVDKTTTKLEFRFEPPASVGAGNFERLATVRVCYDSACNRQVAGSPMQLTVQYSVRQFVVVEEGVAPLTVSARTALSHDVVDAEYSRALDAVVMVSSWPSNALHVYGVTGGLERTVALNKAPIAVSISPDGLSAAVGHDGLVTHVDLSSVGTTMPVIRQLSLSAVTGDLVLDGRGHVFVFPRTDQWVSVHSIDVGSNTETLSYGPYAGTKARLHPSGTRLYAANNGLSPGDIENYDIASGVASRTADSPYHGDYPMCGNVWPSEEGSLLFTACGRAFRASEVAANDMRYAGSLALSGSTSYGWRVLSLSHRHASREIALIEEPWYECTVPSNGTQCFSHLALYESDFLNRRAVFSIPPVDVSSQTYPQHGLFVFHQANGGKVLISRLKGMPNPAAEYYLSLVP